MPDDGYPRTDSPTRVAAGRRQPGPSARRTWRARGPRAGDATLRVIRANPTGRIALKVFVADRRRPGRGDRPGADPAARPRLGAGHPRPGHLGDRVRLGQAPAAVHPRPGAAVDAAGSTRQSWPVRILLGLVGLVFVGAVLLLSLKYSFGIDLIAELLDVHHDSLDPRMRGAARRSGTVGPRPGRLAQRESASFTPKRSLVRSQYRPPGQRPCPIDGHGLSRALSDYLSDYARGSQPSPKIRSMVSAPASRMGRS